MGLGFLERTRTRTNTNPNGTEANAAGRTYSWRLEKRLSNPEYDPSWRTDVISVDNKYRTGLIDVTITCQLE